MNTQDLRALIAERIDVRWSDFAMRHPHLADAIDRVRLVDSAVDLLRDDPEFISAMRGADLDEARLADATKLLGMLDQLVRRLLG
jgi:hypothetical protein